jgi:hypothetical protein
MAVTGETASQTTAAAGAPKQAVEQVNRAGCRRVPGTVSALVAMSAFLIALAACGTTQSAQTSAQPAPAATLSAHTSRQSHIDATVQVAQATYNNETKGGKLFEQLGRIAGDRILLDALSRGDRGGAQAEADAQLRSTLNHTAHVTRISVIRGSRVLVNATVNSDGVYVVAPGTRDLRSHGHFLGTLLVSLQDVTGFVKLVHHLTGADLLVRGASGHVRTSLGAAVNLHLPSSGRVTIAGRGYNVRSFPEIAWGNEPLTVWILERA